LESSKTVSENSIFKVELDSLKCSVEDLSEKFKDYQKIAESIPGLGQKIAELTAKLSKR